MQTPFVGQIAYVGFNFAPVGWHYCDGSLLPISQYEALFNLIGTTYGGNGQTTFALPDLRGRVPICVGQGQGLSAYVLGQVGGVESVTLTLNNYPAHNHTFTGSQSNAGTVDPTGALPASGQQIYAQVNPGEVMNAAMCTIAGPSGGPVPHENIQPYLAANWIIALEGVYPSQS